MLMSCQYRTHVYNFTRSNDMNESRPNGLPAINFLIKISTLLHKLLTNVF